MAADCAFCKIVGHELPEFKVYEDEKFLAFLSIDPKVVGHTIVVPKEHHRWVTDVPEFGEMWSVARKVGLAAKKATGADAVSFLTLGFQVPHAAIWVLPRKEASDGHGKVIDFSIHIHLKKEQYEKLAESIAKSV